MILSGPSGVGKDTILDRLFELDPRLDRVVTCTTRAPRENEVSGRDYIFLSDKEFQKVIEEGGFLEHMKVYAYWYGSPISEVMRIQNKGGIAVLKIDVQGAESVLERYPEVLSIFLLPPDMNELERRLRSRGTESEEKIQNRLQTARDEIAKAYLYQHHVINSDVKQSVETIQKILAESI